MSNPVAITIADVINVINQFSKAKKSVSVTSKELPIILLQHLAEIGLDSNVCASSTVDLFELAEKHKDYIESLKKLDIVDSSTANSNCFAHNIIASLDHAIHHARKINNPYYSDMILKNVTLSTKHISDGVYNILLARYQDNNAFCLILEEPESGEYVCDITINCDYNYFDDIITVKTWGESEGLSKQLEKQKIISRFDTFDCGCGYVDVARLDLSRFESMY